MNKFSAFVLCAGLSSASLYAQTTDLVFFTDDGSKFTLVVDGDVKNGSPATRVVATGIRNESPVVMVRFEDPAIPQLKKPGYFPLGKEYTVMITTNKKGERVLRPTGEAALGTAASAEPAKPKPSDFQDDRSTSTQQAATVQQAVAVDGVQQTTTVTVVEEDAGDGDMENVNMSMGINGVGINMNVAITDGTSTGSSSSTTTTRTTTTTTTTSSGTSATAASRVQPTRTEPVAEPYRMPGYTGPIGCAMPLSGSEFSDLKASLESKSFEETKLTMAKQVTGDRCLSVEQVKAVMGLFSFEESKLDFAKFAYDHTHDIGNYYKVNDAFTFETSIEELNEYIKSR